MKNINPSGITTKSDKTFSFLEVLISCLKYRGFKITAQVLYYYLHIKLFPQINENKTYYLFGFKISYFSQESIKNLLFELFGLNVYYFKTNTTHPVILDIGANIGDSVLYFKSL